MPKLEVRVLACIGSLALGIGPAQASEPGPGVNKCIAASRGWSQKHESAGLRSGTASRPIEAHRVATGGDAWRRVGAIRLNGLLVAGGEPAPFEQTIEIATGYWSTVTSNGGLQDESGFDGGIWDKQNGIVTIADLPSLLEDARTEAWVHRNAWWREYPDFSTVETRSEKGRLFDRVCVTPEAGSGIEIWLDRASHLIDRTIRSTDAGPVTTMYSDWRTVGGVLIAFKRVETDPTLQLTTTIVTKAEVLPEIPRGALARPKAEPRAVATRQVAGEIAFQYTGFDRGHVVVPAEVDGKPANVIFDSGGANYFTPETARRFGLTAGGGINIGGVGSTSVTGGLADVRLISVGGAGLRDQSVIVGPLPYPALHPRAGLVVDGLIGFEFLSEYRTTFDYPRRKISFASFGTRRDASGVTLPFLSDGHSTYVEASVEGATGLFRLDTGDGGGVTVFSAFAEKNGLFRKGGVATLSAGGVGGSVTSRKFEADRVMFAGQTFRHVPMEVSGTSAGAFASRSIAGNIGADIFARFRVTFDYRARTVTFVPAPDVQRPFRQDRTGLSLNQEDGKSLVVLNVAPGSPAAGAGMEAGDRIVAIDGDLVESQGFGIYDLAAPRFRTSSFQLTLMRGAGRKTVTLRPADYLHTSVRLHRNHGGLVGETSKSGSRRNER